MSIVVQCPHCETKFNLQPDMVGKSMRCPNLDCRQVFTVKSMGKEIEPPKSDPVPVPPPRPVPAPPVPKQKKDKPAKPKPAAPQVVDAEIVEAAIVAPPKVKEVVWTEGTDVPPPKGQKPTRPELVDEPDEQPILRRKKKKSRGPIILICGIVGIVLAIGASVFYILHYQDLAEKNLAKQADEEFAKGDHAAAAKSFEKLAADYSGSDDAPKYNFFAALSKMKVAVYAVTNREDPEPALRAFNQFLAAEKDSPLAKPTSGFGGHILDSGKKLGEDVTAHAEDRVKKFKGDRTQSGELERAEKAIATGRELLGVVEQYRAPDDPPLDSMKKEFDRIEGMVKWERDRSAAIARLTTQLGVQSDTAIQAAENELRAAGFGDDEEGKSLIAAAKGRLLELVRYERDPADPRTPPASSAATVLFVAPIGPTRRAPAVAGDDAPPSVFLAVARGILYALDEELGSLLWAVRVGVDITDPPAVARVELAEGPTELAVVASNATGEPAVAGYVVRTGAARWYQPLPAPAAGPAVIVGTRAYVPVRDEQGTIYEFDLTNGTRRGRIRLGQPLGQNAMVVRAGTGLLYAAADARRVYVIDAGAKDDDGNPLPPRCVQVIATNHLPGTLRTPPVLLGPEGDGPGERWMILSQADGRAMLLRAFQLQPISPARADGKAPPETPAVAAAELPINGWAFFQPATDGDRIAVVTDFSQFRIFGVNQSGSFDRAIFPLAEPRPPLPAPPHGQTVPGLVFTAEEAAFWVLANGNLQKYRVELVPSRGVEVNPAGPSIPVGVPTQPPQLNARRNSACLVVRTQNSAGYRAVLVNLRDGELRWQRQLGVVPATNPIPQGDGLLLVAEDGGLVVVPGGGKVAAGRNSAAPPEWVVAAPPANATGPTVVAVSADGQAAFTVTPVLVYEEQKALAKFVVRRVAGGKVVHEGAVIAPAALAGQPVVVGGALLLPLANGSVYRHAAGGGRTAPDTLTAGPPWVSERRGADAVCHLTPLSESSFFTSDGSKKLTKWDWPAGSGWKAGGVTWELRERPAGPGLVLPPADGSGPTRFLIADAAGSVWLYAADRVQHIRRWRPGAAIPAGEPSSPLVAQTDAAGRVFVAYTVEKKFLVCLDPDREHPLWAVRTGEDADAVLVGPPQPAGSGRWMTTDLAGRVTLLEGESGKSAAVLSIGLSGAVPAASGRPLGDAAALTTLSDGSAVVLPLPTASDPKDK